MNNKVRVGAVNYLNTKPLIYGFQQGRMSDEIDLILRYPSLISQMLLDNAIDIGLVPVVTIPSLKESYIISDYCIGCDGAVASVCLFSDVPLKDINKILLDYQSRSSVELLKILIHKHWKISPVIESTQEDFTHSIKNDVAGLVIGDRAFEQRKRSTFIYDLGEEWKNFTGYPFVFAAWVSNKKLEDSFIKYFNEANSIGLKLIDTVVQNNPYNLFDLKEYYTQKISYDLNAEKRKALDLFLSLYEEGREGTGKHISNIQ